MGERGKKMTVGERENSAPQTEEKTKSQKNQVKKRGGSWWRKQVEREGGEGEKEN